METDSPVLETAEAEQPAHSETSNNHTTPVSLDDILNGDVESLGVENGGKNGVGGDTDGEGSGSDGETGRGKKNPAPVGYCVECEGRYSC